MMTSGRTPHGTAPVRKVLDLGWDFSTPYHLLPKRVTLVAPYRGLKLSRLGTMLKP